jgi:hypothetical protein
MTGRYALSLSNAELTSHLNSNGPFGYASEYQGSRSFAVLLVTLRYLEWTIYPRRDQRREMDFNQSAQSTYQLETDFIALHSPGINWRLESAQSTYRLESAGTVQVSTGE